MPQFSHLQSGYNNCPPPLLKHCFIFTKLCLKIIFYVYLISYTWNFITLLFYSISVSFLSLCLNYFSSYSFLIGFLQRYTKLVYVNHLEQNLAHWRAYVSVNLHMKWKAYTIQSFGWYLKQRILITFFKSFN